MKALKTLLSLWVLMGASLASAEPDTFFLGNGRSENLVVNSGQFFPNKYAKPLADVLAGSLSPISIDDVSILGPGQLVLFIQAKGSSLGNDSPIDLDKATDPKSVGLWEFARLAESGGEAGKLNLERPLVNSYKKEQTQIVTVPEYDFVYVAAGGVIRAGSWADGKGGVLAFLVRGSLFNDGKISAGEAGLFDGAGFRGAPANLNKLFCNQNEPAGRGEGLEDGESSSGKENKANGGGGGQCQRAGGGGGGNGGMGGQGASNVIGEVLVGELGGLGGAELSYSDFPGRLILGGGGGAGHSGNPGAAGGAGGGVIFIRAGSLSGAGTISADGSNGANSENGGAGGGGAGGTIILRVAGRIHECPTFSVKGGSGGANTGATDYGPGGGGGGGHIYLQGKGAAACSLASDPVLKGGAAGLLKDGTTSGTNLGAEDGLDGSSSTSDMAMVPPGDAVVVSVSPMHGGFVYAPKPTVKVKAPPGRTVFLRFDDGDPVGTTKTPGSPDSEYTGAPVSNLADGTHTVVAYAVYEGLRGPESYVQFEFNVDATAPDTSIVPIKPAAPFSVTNLRSVVFGFEAKNDSGTDEIGATFECRLGVGGTWSPCAESTTYGDATLVEGSHTLFVRAIDIAGNEDKSPDDFSWEFDWSPPGKPVLNAVPSFVNNREYPFTGTVDANAKVHVYVDDNKVGAAIVAGVNWHFTPPPLGTPPLLSDGPHWIRVAAEDEAGNVGPFSDTAFFTVDTVKPLISITYPGAGAFIRDDKVVILGTAEPGSSVEIKLRIKGMDGDWIPVPVVAGTPGTCTTEEASSNCTNWRYEVLASLDDATYVVDARATDAANNTTETFASSEFTLDQSPPTTTVNGRLPDSTTKDCSEEFVTNAGELVFSLDSSEAGVTYECMLEGDFGFAMLLPECPGTLKSDDYPDSKYTLRVRAKDRAGNVDPSPAICTWTWDTTPPDAVSLPIAPDEKSYPPPAVTDSTLAVFLFSTKDALSETVTFECLLDADPADPTKTFKECPSNVEGGTLRAGAEYSAYPEGLAPLDVSKRQFTSFYATTVTETSHYLYVRARDQAGNRSTPVKHEWLVDTRLPVPDIFPGKGASKATNAKNATFTFALRSKDIDISNIEFFYTLNAGESNPDNFIKVDTIVNGQPTVTIEHSVEKSYFMFARAYDKETKLETPSHLWDSYEWEADWSLPAVDIAVGPATWTRFPTANFVFSAPGEEVRNVRTFLCTISDCLPPEMEHERQDCSDGAPIEGRANYQVTKGLKEGRNCISVWAQDLAGNQSSEPASYEWNLDTQPPEPPVIDTHEGQLTVAARSPVVKGSSEPFADVAVLLDSGTEPVVRVSADDKGRWLARISQLEALDGSHTLRTSAKDRAGNESMVSAPVDILVEASPASVIGGGLGCSTSGTGGSLLALLGLARLLVRGRWRQRT
ncbi:adventurous gliding motility protein AgmC [Archangium gephyra]|uniref:adventurous gliding motility protein AgmC n=1 Tax=Archangium gephyra TaxID=48 RepID=UPI003B7962D0